MLEVVQSDDPVAWVGQTDIGRSSSEPIVVVGSAVVGLGRRQLDPEVRHGVSMMSALLVVAESVVRARNRLSSLGCSARSAPNINCAARWAFAVANTEGSFPFRAGRLKPPVQVLRCCDTRRTARWRGGAPSSMELCGTRIQTIQAFGLGGLAVSYVRGSACLGQNENCRRNQPSKYPLLSTRSGVANLIRKRDIVRKAVDLKLWISVGGGGCSVVRRCISTSPSSRST